MLAESPEVLDDHKVFLFPVNEGFFLLHMKVSVRTLSEKTLLNLFLVNII